MLGSFPHLNKTLIENQLWKEAALLFWKIHFTPEQGSPMLGLSTQGRSLKEDAACLLAGRFKMMRKAWMELRVSAHAPRFTHQLTHECMTRSCVPPPLENRGMIVHICLLLFILCFFPFSLIPTPSLSCPVSPFQWWWELCSYEDLQNKQTTIDLLTLAMMDISGGLGCWCFSHLLIRILGTIALQNQDLNYIINTHKEKLTI